MERLQAFGDNRPLYDLAGQKTYLIVGLGNIGKKYHGTRHNLGFAALEYIAEKNDFPSWSVKKDLKCELAQNQLGSFKVILCRPTTFMNLSGEAVQAVQHFYRLTNEETLVIYDELALPFGQIRARRGGESAGHNGIKSLIEHCGEDFWRIRAGIANTISEQAKAEDFVLGSFDKKEQGNLPMIYREINALMTEFVAGGSLAADTRSVL